jgi:hypothetical protein
MSVEFFIAFGGPVLLALIAGAIVEWIDPPKKRSASPKSDRSDLDSALAEAQAAAHQAAKEIARVRAHLQALQKAS